MSIETQIPIGEGYLVEEIENVKRNLVMAWQDVMELTQKDVHNDQVQWYIDRANRRLDEFQNMLKILEDRQEDRKSLLAEMTLLFGKVNVDKSQTSAYGDEYEEHY